PSGGESDYTAPTISGNYSKGIEGKITVSIYYTGNGVSFSVGGIASGGGIVTTTTPQPIGDSGLYIKFPSTTSSNVTEWVINIPNKKASDYLTNYNAYQVALENQNQTVKNAQASLDQANASLAALLTPARSEDIAQAQANVDSIIAKIQNAKIIAPISGVITQFDAKVGQFASSSVPLVSIISSGGYEIDSGVSETDIGKILIGNKVTMTLDAFPNETFTGTVFYIAPSETNVQGVVDYQVKISFDKSDPRLKSGLTTNIDIQTKHKDNILVLPQYAILQNDQGTFVETLENNVIKQNPVTLGIADQKGNVEIISGVTLGEQVLNIGLKAQ
ncbi:MAG: efflux RND transporter periplasmic adaptor subunit, partial [Candidatus Nomurabacteria bacterium]|nr:efflux RND transporter periplasmic adaptor subunit [Candidatus Nomurabacteria bacterium]